MTSIIPDLTSNENAVSSRIDQYFIQNSFSKLLKRCNFYKESGIPCVTILKELFTLVFTGKNLFRTLEMKPEELSFRKNTAYRFLNSGHYNWSKLLLLL
ncbi:IS4 family transposase, partial [Dehalobacter restrictus]